MIDKEILQLAATDRMPSGYDFDEAARVLQIFPQDFRQFTSEWTEREAQTTITKTSFQLEKASFTFGIAVGILAERIATEERTENPNPGTISS